MHVFRTLLAQYSVESSPLVSADWGKSDMGEGVLEETALAMHGLPRVLDGTRPSC